MGENETNELFGSWVEVSFLSRCRLTSSNFSFFSCLTVALFLGQFSARLANVAQNRVYLAEEVQKLKAKGKTYFDDLYRAKEAERITESKLADAERAMKVDHQGFEEEWELWGKEKVNLILTCDYAVTTKVDVEAKVKAAELRVTEMEGRLAEAEELVKTE